MHRTLFCSKIRIRVHATGSGDQGRVRSVGCFVSEGISLLVITPGRTTTIAPIIRGTCKLKVPIIMVSHGVLSSHCATFINTSGYRVNGSIKRCVIGHLNKGKGVLRVAKLRNSAPTVRHREKLTSTLGTRPKVRVATDISKT